MSLAGLALLAPLARADTITLTNGHVIEAERAWFEGSEIRYLKNGGVYGLPRSLVSRLEQRGAPDPDADPGVVKGRERLAAGDAATAAEAFESALARRPDSVAALDGLAEAQLRLGQARAARDAAAKAVRLEERSPRSRALLGDALAALGERAAAEAEYKKSLQLRPDAEVQRRLDALAPSSRAARGPRFRVRYDGGINEPLGVALLAILSDAHAEYQRRLGFGLEEPVTVVLEVGATLDEQQAPGWAAAVNDGTIHVPVHGIDQPTPRLTVLLRHELAHSFVRERTLGNCPTWLQEGISQWLEGGDPARSDPTLAVAARQGKLIPLLTLEGPFQPLTESEAALAYAESLSAVAHVLRRRGEAGVVRLLSALGDRLPSEEALPVALGLSYAEFQKDWADYLITPLSPKGRGEGVRR